MALQTKSYFRIIDESAEPRSQAWSLSFSREGKKIVVGMHWNEKVTATHEFTANFSDFLKEVEKLK